MRENARGRQSRLLEFEPKNLIKKLALLEEHIDQLLSRKVFYKISGGLNITPSPLNYANLFPVAWHHLNLQYERHNIVILLQRIKIPMETGDFPHSKRPNYN